MQSSLADLLQGVGTQRRFAPGALIYAEAKRVRSVAPADICGFLLLSGEVTLTRNGKPLELVMQGELFGATSLLSDGSRMATAVARKESLVATIDRKQLLAALGTKPEIALLVIDALAKRLQHSYQRATKKGVSVPEPLVNVAKLPPGAVDQLRTLLGDPVPARADAGGTLITKDGKGLFMYVLIDGRVAISVNEQVVEYPGPESVFGELALLNSANRAATAVAVEASSWLAIGRDDFLRVVKTNPPLGMALLRSMSDRVRFAGFLLSETPAVLRALNEPRLNAAAAGKILGSVRMLYNRSASAFLSEARDRMAALEPALQEKQRAEPLRLLRELQQMAKKIGAERYAFQAAVLEGIIESSEQIGLDAHLAVLQEEFQDTAEEIGDYLKKA